MSLIIEQPQGFENSLSHLGIWPARAQNHPESMAAEASGVEPLSHLLALRLPNAAHQD